MWVRAFLWCGLVSRPTRPRLLSVLTPFFLCSSVTKERTAASSSPGLFMIMFSIISIEFFGLEAVESGYLMSYFGVLQMVVQGLVIGKLTSHCTEQTLLRFSILLFAGVGLGMALMRTVWHYCIIVVPLVFAFNVQGTITDSILTKAVPSSDTGAMLGICASVQPLTRTVGPTLGVILYRQFGVSSFGYLQLIVNAGLFVYLLKRKSPLRETKSH
ncbi:solute carrier family 22 member 18-like [Coturnix japonica]|uniref:solute carrier family 22 member 18-like n=1 Tax=Coturnix japonica TaxID=93934 RepID=UPI000777AD43|nr:solute carrier family 22 member 18-like [Coturnix japonica]